MARFALALACAAVMVAVASAQFDYFGGLQGGFAAPRDPRENRGPVTFPVTQPGAETSGVRVGASGYGFVPPGHRGGGKKHLKKTQKSLVVDEDEEDIEMEMARFQLAKMTNLENVRKTMMDGIVSTERRLDEAKSRTDVQERELGNTLYEAMESADERAQNSLREAEKRLMLVLEKWNFNKRRF